MTLRATILTAALVLFGQGALAQSAEISLGGMELDTSLPVEVTSESLSVEDENGLAVFEGDVLVVQGDMRLAAEMIRVEYSETDNGTEISQMIASGGVTFTNGTDAAEAAQAIYSPEAGTLRMEGDVVLTQGPSVISGRALAIDLASGTGVIEGRVRTVFQSGGQ